MAMSVLYPYVHREPSRGVSVLAAAVAGELHEIGVRMVEDFFAMAGFEAFYLGQDALVAEVTRRGAGIVALSASMSRHISSVERQITLLRSELGGECPKILVGGRAFTLEPDAVTNVGADGHGADAAAAVTAAEAFV